LENMKCNRLPDTRHFRTQCLCPWWICFSFDNIIRRWVQNPEKTVKPYIKPGWTVLDVGPGMGYFTIALARLVGDSGKVIAADLQQHMLDGIQRRAIRAGVQDRIKLHRSAPDKIGISEPIDFSLAFWMLHEVPDRRRFLNEIFSALKPGGLFLLAEPKLHVSFISFTESVSYAKSVGFSVIDHPKIFFSYAVVFKNK
jgi:ubiquinone/menaquinone biosynthesis C-methylase UbiE